MADSEHRRGRIVLAIDTCSLTRPALEAAAALAVGLRSELSVLFVEDEQLLRLASVPFAHEIDLPLAHLQRIGLDDMEQAFRVQTEQLRRVVEETARCLALAWAFGVTRGEILSVSLAQLRREDLLVVGKGRLAGFPLGGWPGEAGPFDALAARSVMVFFGKSETGLRALEAGFAIARVIGSQIAVLISARSPEAFRASRERAQRWLADRDAAARYLPFAGGDVAALARAVRSQGAGVLIWPSPATEQALPALGALLEELACPVVVLPLRE